MKTKNTRVRLSQVKQGRIIYIASAKFNYIDAYLVKSKPYLENFGYESSLFIKAQRINQDGQLHDYYDAECPSCSKSLWDMGVLPNTYNDRKTFFKRKHAEAYIKRFAK